MNRKPTGQLVPYCKLMEARGLILMILFCLGGGMGRGVAWTTDATMRVAVKSDM